ncbi:phosphonate ABC transporter, permease protein PhnE [Candidatus Woesearchaeota archaeon]|jgi:phosphonate transport system permease protein|nr:phosphonate ABC transporter, permease protein PhnE [Candidatus Woesearchaeota archaeon]MBT4368838.1 phosphonate ABC transporter, permease protein PhnE [Candidatus Woesearchaeota archaeon]MBT4712127.1 phosphonate ABC transporter, permease protein PhnE [Candidatus Woesearchaeota archaeon]MBT6639125.1 phosphonate ABC transporter, permease protein PhnE [Candidatus Woesearchaeota archaeon]MBT7134325.1 phosphonate ABC transporter, permease protein PhnE [Candidatus Woesearchaeota archaeon]
MKKIPNTIIKKKYQKLIIGLLIVLVYYWAISGTGTSPTSFAQGIPHMADFIRRMFPPDFSNIGTFLLKGLETLQMAILGTTIGAIIALPLSFLAARNIMPNKFVYHTIRTFFDICRGINEIVWGLIFVSMVGLGPFPGVLALSAHVAGALGRYFSESIETVDPKIIKAILSTGANKIQVVIKGIIPQVKPAFINYILYYLENNFRAATVLGLVGAGGIGMELLTSMRLFKNQEVLTILMIMVGMVILIDRISATIRKRVVGIKTIE